MDVSIWLTQFIKAMRDSEGNMIRNAHLLGTFRRVCKVSRYLLSVMLKFIKYTKSSRDACTLIPVGFVSPHSFFYLIVTLPSYSSDICF